MGKKIRLSESALRQLVERTTRRALKESGFYSKLTDSYFEDDGQNSSGVWLGEQLIDSFFDGDFNLAIDFLEELSMACGSDSISEIKKMLAY